MTPCALAAKSCACAWSESFAWAQPRRLTAVRDVRVPPRSLEPRRQAPWRRQLRRPIGRGGGTLPEVQRRPRALSCSHIWASSSQPWVVVPCSEARGPLLPSRQQAPSRLRCFSRCPPSWLASVAALEARWLARLLLSLRPESREPLQAVRSAVEAMAPVNSMVTAGRIRLPPSCFWTSLIIRIRQKFRTPRQSVA